MIWVNPEGLREFVKTNGSDYDIASTSVIEWRLQEAREDARGDRKIPVLYHSRFTPINPTIVCSDALRDALGMSASDRPDDESVQLEVPFRRILN